MANSNPAFQRYQEEFAAHIRNPRTNPRPRGVEARRMAVYSELLYNNIESFLLLCFPVLRKMLGTRRWNRLVRAFFSTHRCHTPYFRQIPDEFVQFLQSEWEPDTRYPDYMLELAHYEWIELVLSVSVRDADLPACDAAGDLMKGVPLVNPVLANLAYNWPVHRIRPRMRVRPEPSWLLVFRDRDQRVRFMEQSAASARLLSLLEQGDQTGEQAVSVLAAEMGMADQGSLREFARQFLQSLQEAGAVLGTRC